MRKTTAWYYFLLGAPIIVVATVIIDLLLFGNIEEFAKENRGIETASFLLLFYAAVGFLALAPDRGFGASWHVPTVLFMLAARELDFDKKFLADGIYRAKLYTRDNPVLHKIIGGAALFLTFWIIWRLVRRSGPGWVRALRNLDLWAWLMLSALLFVVIAKTIDGAGRKMRRLFDVEVPQNVSNVLVVAEELMELGFGMLIVAAIAFWVRDLRS